MAGMLRGAECGRTTTDDEETPAPRRHGWRLVVDVENLNIVYALCPEHAGGRRRRRPGDGGRPRGPVNLTPWRPEP
jgi:hypothetical protein